MSRRSRGKSRFERRKAHAVLTKGRANLVAAVEQIIEKPLQPHQKERTVAALAEAEKVQHHALSSVPARAVCPRCERSQKVKRDGTMGRHDVIAGDGVPVQCRGTGEKWND